MSWVDVSAFVVEGPPPRGGQLDRMFAALCFEALRSGRMKIELRPPDDPVESDGIPPRA